MTKSLKLKKEIVSACQRLFEQNLLAACDGNISCKSGFDIFITPKAVSKKNLQPKDIAYLNSKGQTRKGSPSSEKLMHLSIYQECPKAKAVVHAHPPYAVSLSLARPKWNEIPFVMAEVVLAVGKIPIVPYARPGTKAMGEVLKPFLKESKALILSRHGAVTWGDSLKEACLAMERLEHTCQMVYLSEALGGGRVLPAKELKALFKIRHSLGDKVF